MNDAFVSLNALNASFRASRASHIWRPINNTCCHSRGVLGRCGWEALPQSGVGGVECPQRRFGVILEGTAQSCVLGREGAAGGGRPQACAAQSWWLGTEARLEACVYWQRAIRFA